MFVCPGTSINWNYLTQETVSIKATESFKEQICCCPSDFECLPLSDGTVGQFSEALLHKWMPFVIFHTRSHERLQLPLLGQFLSRSCFALCVTMEVECRLAKLYKCHYCCICKNYRGTVVEDGKKCMHHSSEDCKFVGFKKKYFSIL